MKIQSNAVDCPNNNLKMYIAKGLNTCGERRMLTQLCKVVLLLNKVNL